MVLMNPLAGQEQRGEEGNCDSSRSWSSTRGDGLVDFSFYQGCSSGANSVAHIPETTEAYLPIRGHIWGITRVALVVKNLPANAGDMRCGFNPWVRRIPWGRARDNPL